MFVHARKMEAQTVDSEQDFSGNKGRFPSYYLILFKFLIKMYWFMEHY